MQWKVTENIWLLLSPRALSACSQVCFMLYTCIPARNPFPYLLMLPGRLLQEPSWIYLVSVT